MKYVAFVLSFAFVSLTFCTPPQEEPKPKAQWKEIICPECKGTGFVKMSTTSKNSIWSSDTWLWIYV